MPENQKVLDQGVIYLQGVGHSRFQTYNIHLAIVLAPWHGALSTITTIGRKVSSTRLPHAAAHTTASMFAIVKKLAKPGLHGGKISFPCVSVLLGCRIE